MIYISTEKHKEGAISKYANFTLCEIIVFCNGKKAQYFLNFLLEVASWLQRKTKLCC